MTLVPLRLATDGFFTSQSAGENTLNPATLDAIRDSVWTAVLAQYQTAGTAGKALSDAAKASLAQAGGRFVINYDPEGYASTATQYNPDGTVYKIFALLNAEGDPAINAQTAVERVPQ